VKREALLSFKDSPTTNPSGRLCSWVVEDYCNWTIFVVSDTSTAAKSDTCSINDSRVIADYPTYSRKHTAGTIEDHAAPEKENLGGIKSDLLRKEIIANHAHSVQKRKDVQHLSPTIILL
jgi:hypothetical protein